MEFTIKINKRKNNSVRVVVRTDEKEMTVFGSVKNIPRIVGGIVFKFFKEKEKPNENQN